MPSRGRAPAAWVASAVLCLLPACCPPSTSMSTANSFLILFAATLPFEALEAQLGSPCDPERQLTEGADPLNPDRLRCRIIHDASQRAHDRGGLDYGPSEGFATDFIQMVARDDDYALCADIFEGSPSFMQGALAIAGRQTGEAKREANFGIGLQDGAARFAIARALAAADWKSVFSTPREGVYACTALDSLQASQFSRAKIYVYNNACSLATIYGHDFSRYETTTRLVFVIAHELGHVIDTMSGRIESDSSSADAESTASGYATHLIECHTRRIARQYERKVQSEPEEGRKKIFRCYADHWSRLETSFRVARADWKVLTDFENAKLGTAFACAGDLSAAKSATSRGTQCRPGK